MGNMVASTAIIGAHLEIQRPDGTGVLVQDTLVSDATTP